jgi:hypothetical protein
MNRRIREVLAVRRSMAAVKSEPVSVEEEEITL